MYRGHPLPLISAPPAGGLSGSSDQSLVQLARRLHQTYGLTKEMGKASQDENKPHFFLHRQFLGDNDLLVIFNTKRCRYQCSFCSLPAKSSRAWIDGPATMQQFAYVLGELRHSLGVIERVTLSNEGSVLDEKTFDSLALDEIIKAIRQLRKVRTLAIETRLEFVELVRMAEIRSALPRRNLEIVTGFETYDDEIRTKYLGKRETIESVLDGLDRIAISNARLAAYVLYKPVPTMTDAEAYAEAKQSVDFLSRECSKRNIVLTVRLNPMYVAEGSKWAEIARTTPNYQPPLFDDVLALADEIAAAGTPSYVAPLAEGLAGDGDTFHGRAGFSGLSLKRVMELNARPWPILQEVR